MMQLYILCEEESKINSVLAPFNFPENQIPLINTIFDFVYNTISIWRDNPKRIQTDDERLLVPDMLEYFYVCLRKKELNFNFHHQKSQGGHRSIDISVAYNNYEKYNVTITVFECKRLFVFENNRKDEYVIGHKKTGGGIQRFKIEAHGKEHDTVGMIGYVQTQSINETEKLINECISNLSAKPSDGLKWDKKEQLEKCDNDPAARKYRGISVHPRKTKQDIVIHHFWVDMQN